MTEAEGDELIAMAGYVTDLANKREMCIIGFIWGVKPPTLMKFSNTNETAPRDVRALLSGLADLYEDKVKSKQVLLMPTKESAQA
jgi:hypothetical protein